MPGRPNARGQEHRAPRLRVTRATRRREQFDLNWGRACSDTERVAATSDYIRGALKANPDTDTAELVDLLDELAGLADRIYAEAARQANRDANTPRRRRAA